MTGHKGVVSSGAKTDLRFHCSRISCGHLPDSYLLSDKSDISGTPRPSGNFADIRMGVFKGKGVVELGDRMKTCKIGIRATASHPCLLTRCAAALQRSCQMEGLVPSQLSLEP